VPLVVVDAVRPQISVRCYGWPSLLYHLERSLGFVSGACFGETEQRCGYLPGLWQFPADDASGSKPKHDLQILGWIAEARAQLSTASEGCNGPT
jgi:hypothetical protein